MSKLTLRNLLLLPILGIVFLVGCGGDSESTPETPAATEGASEDSAEARIEKALGELADEDRALAVKQDLCPVTDQKLGSMGAPKKVMVGDQAVFICCEGCEEALTSEPDKYLAKLAKE